MDGVFIAYPFRQDTQAVVDGIIRPVLLGEGIRYLTGHDKESSSGEMICSLRRTIADCSAIIAVVSGRNPNVFFEIGVAASLAKPCILLASAPTDAAMLEGAYPLVVTTSAEKAMQELRQLLQACRSLALGDDGQRAQLRELAST
jgi:hypothetical protein